MVKLTTKYIIRQINSRKQFLVRRKKETDKQYLSRITHLYLQNQFIDQIMKVTDCQSVSVIYMQNNMLRTLDNIGSFPNLTHLYLQRNFLTKIEHLESLQKLKKIYLGFNEILVLEGFADLPNLQEIHIECQDLPAGETLLFEPLTVGNLETMLKVLDVSQNNLSTLSGLRGLRRLEVLIANNNRLSDLKDVINTLKEWPFLKKLSLLGNPVVGQRWYRDSIIFASKSLEMLDDKIILDITRKFIEKLTERRNCPTRREEVQENERERKELKSVTFRESSAVEENLIGPPQTSSDTPYSASAWQLRANINPVNPKTFLPRPYWKKGGMEALRVKSSELRSQRCQFLD